MVDRPRLTPEQVAGRAFPTSFRGFEQSEVRAFLATVAEDLQAASIAGELVAADVIAKAEARAADLLAEAQDEARRVRATLEAERERAFAEGAARADELIAEAERLRGTAETVGGAEAERLITEAKAVRERILGDLARRRATLREQVEQLHAARERLLGALGELRTQVDEASGELRAALPEAKAAADAAARRVSSEALPTTEELEAEIAAFRAAGLELLGGSPEVSDDLDATPASAPEPAVPAAAATPEPEPDTAPAGANGTAETAAKADDTQLERRSAAVRVFRTRRDPTPALGLHETELHEVEPAAPFEEVRLVTAEDAGIAEAQEAAADEAQAGVPAAIAEAPAAEHSAVEGPADPVGGSAEVTATAAQDTDQTASGAPPPPEAIDELFARLKAGREQRKTTAEAVLVPAATPTAPAVATQAARTESIEAASPPPPADPVVVATPAPVAAAPPGASAAAESERAELERRDAALREVREGLARRLKRQLADEQNEVLDALRRGETRAFVLADADDHAAAWSFAAARDLAVAADAGASFDGGSPGGPISATEVAAVAGSLADAFAVPLRTKVLEAIDAADGDRDVAADAVRSVYRDRRGRRLDDVVEHAVLDAFSTGVLTAAPVGAEFVWVVDDGDAQCPDCDDNALGGAVSGGSPFPTGDVRPPAHPGCRCLLLRARAR